MPKAKKNAVKFLRLDDPEVCSLIDKERERLADKGVDASWTAAAKHLLRLGSAEAAKL